jgi:septal ring factor EnvC (AmiA/AmiB activator)
MSGTRHVLGPPEGRTRAPGMTRERIRMTRAPFRILIAVVLAAPAVAQDIRGLEVCTAEKTMERRTSCLQSNVEFLHQALDKQTRETRIKLDAAAREAAAQKAEIATLKATLAKLQRELTDLKKSKPEKK